MMKKIILYKSPSCEKCSIAKFILQRILTNKGLSYDEIVEEKDVKKDRNAMAELLMYGALNTPLIIIGDKIFKDDDALKENLLNARGDKKYITHGFHECDEIENKNSK
jgi:glutaredoxin